MQIKKVEFVKSSSHYSQCPKSNMPEYAFVGRSNVGKSTLINYLTDKKRLAKTSGKPGHTKLINHFIVNDSWHLVDLPGYGYAKISKSERKVFYEIITSYLINRSNMVCLFLLIDSRHKPLQLDLEFMQWLGENQVPFVICFTKVDKLGVEKRQVYKNDYCNKLAEYWEELPQVFESSASAKVGKDEILDFININNGQYYK